MSMFQDYLKPTAVLTTICIVVTGALAYTEQVTTPIIEQAKIEAAQLARIEVLPTADNFTKLEGEMPTGIVEIYTADNGVGAVITTSSKGYGGEVEIMCSIDAEGKLLNVKVLSANETPGIGTKVINDKYIASLSGADTTLEGVDGVSGATYTSTAFLTNLRQAFDAYDALIGGGN